VFCFGPTRVMNNVAVRSGSVRAAPQCIPCLSDAYAARLMRARLKEPRWNCIWPSNTVAAFANRMQMRV